MTTRRAKLLSEPADGTIKTLLTTRRTVANVSPFAATCLLTWATNLSRGNVRKTD